LEGYSEDKEVGALMSLKQVLLMNSPSSNHSYSGFRDLVERWGKGEVKVGRVGSPRLISNTPVSDQATSSAQSCSKKANF
jgi:hypothetical protein